MMIPNRKGCKFTQRQERSNSDMSQKVKVVLGSKTRELKRGAYEGAG